MADIRAWAIAAARAADEKLAVDPMIIDVGDVLSITDYFVITSGTNPRQVRAIAEEVEESLGSMGGPKPVRVEGRDELEWVLLDYGAFVVHVFHEDAREYYDLERLWSDRERIAWQEGTA